MGPAALAHNMAEEAKIEPAVTITILSGTVAVNGIRSAVGVNRDIPEVATIMNGRFTVSPVIRGYELRTFVECHTPEERYADVAKWLRLGPLVEVQKSIRTLRTRIKSAAEDGNALKQVDTQLGRETVDVIKTWDSAAVLDYANTSVLASLDLALRFTVLARTDPTYTELEVRTKGEENRIGLAGLRQLRIAATALWTEVTNADRGETVISGAIPSFISAMATLSRRSRIKHKSAARLQAQH